MPRPAEPEAVSAALLRAWPLPAPGEDKHDRGTVLVVAGAPGTPGAALLAGLGALRAGAGRLQVATAEPTATALAVALPEAMVLALETEEGTLGPRSADRVCEAAARADAVVLGPGLLHRPTTARLLAAVLPRLDVPLVIDAVALAALPDAGARPSGAVAMTPNTGELAALLGQELPLEEAVPAAAAAWGAAVGSRGLTVAADGRAWNDPTGGPGLGTSGSGDVLAGLVGGLLARGCPPEQAVVWGQHLHAAAGDALAERTGQLGYLARELLDEVPRVMAALG